MEEIINSVTQSPENTNPNVLRSQLQNIGEGSGGSGGVYAVTMEQIDGKFTLNKTVQEIITACQKKTVLLNYEDSGQAIYAPLAYINITSRGTANATFGALSFSADTVNDYPVIQG